MIKVDPNEPTEEERREGITKLRYMTFREVRSTSNTLGFRIEGVRTASEPPRSSFQKVSQLSEVQDIFASFLPDPDSPIRREVGARRPLLQ